ncbi:MAG: FAD binding domain-containing protein, partial [Candidatus Aureabacteria bacterium]|nr:FAD binding domain-containing protein [Candidatus Auribacterota bacterium]
GNPGSGQRKSQNYCRGTDLILEIKQGVRIGISSLVDISRIPELTEISIDLEGFIHIGPGVTHNHCVASDVIRKFAFPIAQACYGIGTPQIRNVAKVAGNLATASPANDTIVPLIAMEAEVVLASKKKSRTIKLVDFYNGVRSTVLQPEEMIVDIKFNKLADNQKGVFKRYILRETHSISVVNASIIITFQKNLITSASLALGCVAKTVFRAKDAERFLIGKKLNEENIKMAAELAQKAANPISDIRASDKYRLGPEGSPRISSGRKNRRFASPPGRRRRGAARARDGERRRGSGNASRRRDRIPRSLRRGRKRSGRSSSSGAFAPPPRKQVRQKRGKRSRPAVKRAFERS